MRDNLPLGAARLQNAVRACAIFYYFLGFSTVSWMSRIPSIRDTLAVTPSQVGTIFFVGALGSLLALPGAGPLIGAIGTRRTMRGGVSLWLLGMTGMTLSIHYANAHTFAASLMVVSAGFSLWGSVMNVEGGMVEAARGRKLLPQLHALFSVGAVSGAALTAPITLWNIPVAIHLAALALPIWLVILTAAHWMLSEEETATFAERGAKPLEGAKKRQQVKARTRQAWTEKRTLMIAVLVIAGGLLEGSANDWLALAMVDGYGFQESTASLVFASFLLVMVAVRLMAPRLILVTGEARLLKTLLRSSILGLILMGFAPHWSIALIGVVLWALGASLVFPLCGSALSYEPHMTAARMSVMTSFEFLAYLAAPPLLGFAAEYLGYQRSLTLMIPMIIVSAYLTKYLPTPRAMKTVDTAA